MTFSGGYVETTDLLPFIVVCDAGPLIHLDEVGCLDLLSDFSRVLVPSTVWTEVQRHREQALQNRNVELIRIVPIAPEPPALEALGVIFSLHVGEWEALRVALENPSSVLLTDDTAARLAAGNLGIRTHGTVGILVRSIRRNQRSKQQVLSILESLPTVSSLHLKRSLLDSVIQSIQNEG